MTVEDLWALKRFGAPTLSPDGRWACVAVTGHSMKTNEATSQLWLLATDGSAQRPLTSGRKDADPQWSPDGRWIAFTSKRQRADGSPDDEAQLYLIAIEGGEAIRATEVATGVAALRWFPDSRRIAFVSWVWPDAKTPKAQAKRMKADRADLVKAHAVETNQYRHWDHWFPRGRRPHLHVATLSMAGDGSSDPFDANVTDLFAGTDFHLPPQEPDAALYDISPDGDEVAFTFDFDPEPRSPAFTDVVLFDVRRGRWRAPTRHSPRSQEGPRYSPDGRWIAMLSSDLAHRYNAQARIELIRRADDALVPLTFDWDRGVHGPVLWSHDARRILFVAETGIAQPVWQVEVPDAAAAQPAQATPAELVRGPHHGGVATDLARSGDGTTLVYARSSMVMPPSLYACDASGRGERPLERFNAPMLDGIAIATTRSVTIAGHGGDDVQMWVVTPPDFEDGSHRGPKRGKSSKNASRRWPLMHMIHGGPHTCLNDAWHWRWNMALFAAQGYVVAAVNYHGSTGWGQDFITTINGDVGRRELADIEAGTDHLLATGRIDPDRIVATGGSYGGFMVALMNGRATRGRYAAYVCHAGCYDWVAMMGTDSYFWIGHELGGFPWQDEAHVLEQSPHHHAAAFETPTLVIHGELDYRVPYYQGVAYYNTLRVLGVPTRLLMFPDENHWIVKPQNSRLWYREFFDWLERFAGPNARKRAASHEAG